VKLEVFIRAHASDNPETIKLYLREARRFTGWLGSRPLDLETVQEYEDWLKAHYKANSLSNKVTGVNLYLKWRETDFRIRRPSKQVAANPKIVSDQEYHAVLERIKEPAERLVVRILHDSLLRPSDVVKIRLADLGRSEGVTIIRKATQKTGAVSESILTKETAAELDRYIESARIADYVFPGESGRPCRHRTWPNGVLRKYGADGITPRTFRRTGATKWGEDLTSLMAQGGWSDPRTVLKHYRKNLRDRHLREFESAIGPASDRDDEGPSGYA
jgi:integrase